MLPARLTASPLLCRQVWQTCSCSLQMSTSVSVPAGVNAQPELVCWPAASRIDLPALPWLLQSMAGVPGQAVTAAVCRHTHQHCSEVR